MVEANQVETESEEETMTKEEAIEALFKAVKGEDGKRGDVDAVKMLLDKGDLISANEMKDGWSPLLLASCNGDEAMVRLLLKYQAHAPYQKSFKQAEESVNQSVSQPVSDE
jgi:ankyrin repeat protein